MHVRFLQTENQKFHVGTISWKQTVKLNLQRTMWYQEAD